MGEFDQPQPGDIRFDNPNDSTADININDGGEGGIAQKVGSIFGAIVIGVISYFWASGSERGDMSDSARGIIDDELEEMEDAHPALYAANEDYLDGILDVVHEEAFEAIYEQGGSADNFDPNAYFSWVFQELIGRAEADQKWDLADALYAEYEPFEQGVFAFEVGWQPF